MTHPSEHLAPFVDGSLPPAEHAAVERHLASCPRCRREAQLASEARVALRSLPAVSPPPGVGDAALVEMAEQERRASSGARPRWTKLVPVAAAAAVVGLLAIALPRIGGGAADEGAVAPSASRAAPAPGELRLEIQRTDYDADSLGTAAREFATTVESPEEAPAQDGAQELGGGTTASPAATSRFASAARTAPALRCVRSAFPKFPGRPVRLIRASFDGTPAYLAYVLEGPGAGQPPDTVSIWVASVGDCSTLSLSTVSL